MKGLTYKIFLLFYFEFEFLIENYKNKKLDDKTLLNFTC